LRHQRRFRGWTRDERKTVTVILFDDSRPSLHLSTRGGGAGTLVLPLLLKCQASAPVVGDPAG
jgi:hypothetical protein